MKLMYILIIQLLTLVVGIKSQLKPCNALNSYNFHFGLTNNQSEYKAQYIPKSSCLLCTKLNNDVKDSNGNRNSSTDVLQVYNNMLEFGFYYFQFPTEFRANVRITNDCGFQLYARRPIGAEKPDSLWVEWRDCPTPTFQDCVAVHNFTHPNLNFPRSCLFFTFRFFGPERIYEASSRYCNTSSTNNLRDSKILRPIQCPFNDKASMTVQYHFVHNKTTPTDGIPLVLPCSPGGYAVDPMTGRFVTGDYCKTLFRTIDGGIDLIISKFYGGNEHYRFPTYEKPEDLVRRFPIYITSEGKGKSPGAMAPNVLDCNFKYIRTGCTAEVQKKTTEEAEKDPRCRKAYEEVFQDIDALDSNDIVNVIPPSDELYPGFDEEVSKRLDEAHKKKDAKRNGGASEVASGAETVTMDKFSKILIGGFSIIPYLVFFY